MLSIARSASGALPALFWRVSFYLCLLWFKVCRPSGAPYWLGAPASCEFPGFVMNSIERIPDKQQRHLCFRFTPITILLRNLCRLLFFHCDLSNKEEKHPFMFGFNKADALNWASIVFTGRCAQVIA